MSKKSCLVLYSKAMYKMGQDFLDIQFKHVPTVKIKNPYFATMFVLTVYKCTRRLGHTVHNISFI